MAKGKGGRKIGRLLIIGGIAAVGYYGYTKGWFKPVQDWLKTISGGSSTPTDAADTTTPGQDTTIELPNIDLSGVGTFLSDAWNSLTSLFKNPADQTVTETVSDIVGSIVKPVATAAGVSAAGLATTTSVAAATQAPIAPALSASSSSALVRQFGKLAAAGPGTQLAALVLGAVPVFIGTSPAVAAGVHSANVAITNALTKAGLYKETGIPMETYKVTVPGSNTKNVIVTNKGVYDAQGNLLNVSAADVKKAGTKVGTRTTVPTTGGQWNGKRWTG